VTPPDTDYRAFWDSVGSSFPSLKGAPSTDYYFECESLLLGRFPGLAGRRLLKTDLWDEAKNTEILRWAAEQGARPLGVDISLDVVREAAAVLRAHRPGFARADVRALPFRDGSVDLVYSMGTIEHFPDYAVAVREIHRVLAPGGQAIVGVPNKLDPFLRPALVHVMNLCGLYGYGMEKSFTPRALSRLLESAGFEVQALTGILFIPGWLRMLDLLCHTRWPRLAVATGALVWPFAWLYRHVPAVRRHGYMIACIIRKGGPDGPAQSSPRAT
jgi:SAM-dependent methyltransferase